MELPHDTGVTEAPYPSPNALRECVAKRGGSKPNTLNKESPPPVVLSGLTKGGNNEVIQTSGKLPAKSILDPLDDGCLTPEAPASSSNPSHPPRPPERASVHGGYLRTFRLEKSLEWTEAWIREVLRPESGPNNCLRWGHFRGRRGVLTCTEGGYSGRGNKTSPRSVACPREGRRALQTGTRNAEVAIG
jgi:hypothetical protein